MHIIVYFSICLSFRISWYLDHYLANSVLLYKFRSLMYLVNSLSYHLVRITKIFIFKLNNHLDLNQFWTKCENWLVIFVVLFVKTTSSILEVLIFFIISSSSFVRHWNVLFSNHMLCFASAIHLRTFIKTMI